jgi:hypothetical protein
MTETLHVRRLHLRYHLAEDDAVGRRRLDALVARVLDEELEPALLRRGVPVGEEVCVRAVHAPARVRLAAGNGAAEAWSEAIADAIAAAVARGGDGVVRYRSRRAALADVAVSVASGRLERIWAWRRLGLWRGGDAPDPRGAAAELISALVAEPESIVAVLAEAAGAGALPRLLELLAAEEWAELARAALAAAGARPGLAVATGPAGARRARRDGEDSVAAVHVVRASALARALGAADIRLSVEITTALAVLAWLEAEPAAAAAASYADAAEAVRRVAGLLSTPDRTSALEPAEEAPPTEGAHAEAPEREETVVPALTRFGGLLFLLGVLDELGVPTEVLGSPSLGQRPLRWTLHRLALTLAPAADGDPAALAFAGLPPEAAIPDEDVAPVTADERLALGVLAGRVAERVRERLERPGVAPDELLDIVCRRRGEIVFDPGWLELRLPFDEISVELRRAGLDLDPGWLPWLGCVVRFVYA